MKKNKKEDTNIKYYNCKIEKKPIEMNLSKNDLFLCSKAINHKQKSRATKAKVKTKFLPKLEIMGVMERRFSSLISISSWHFQLLPLSSSAVPGNSADIVNR